VAVGPVAALVDAGSSTWQFYAGGVISDASCGTDLDHSVSIVGYGTLLQQHEYWIVKNSWGESWGINGYLYILRGVGECGLNLYVTSSIIKK